MSKVKITVVDQVDMNYDFENDTEFKDPSAYYIINALAQRVYIHVRSRKEATEWVKEYYDGKYTVRAAKLQKTKSKLESGGLSCVGHQTTKGQRH